jgi:flagella basal body P-ring formation protein FlgA
MMNRRTIILIAMICLIFAGGVIADSQLRIHLLREAEIDNDIPNLGQVSIIRGDDMLVAKASQITLGQFSQPNQELILERPIVLGRLASVGISSSQVILTGAESIKIKRQHETIEAKRFLETALALLKKNPPSEKICQFSPIRQPLDFTTGYDMNDITLVPSLLTSSIRNQARVLISILADGKEIDKREIPFSLKYNYRRAITKIEIPKGAVISPENIIIETKPSSYPEPANWKAPYGLVARRTIPQNTFIHPSMAGPIKPEVLIKRNQNVVIKIDRFGLSVTTIGVSMQEGAAGEFIRVRNIDSQRIITTKINDDGTVEPVY